MKWHRLLSGSICIIPSKDSSQGYTYLFEDNRWGNNQWFRGSTIMWTLLPFITNQSPVLPILLPRIPLGWGGVSFCFIERSTISTPSIVLYHHTLYKHNDRVLMCVIGIIATVIFNWQVFLTKIWYLCRKYQSEIWYVDVAITTINPIIPSL